VHRVHEMLALLVIGPAVGRWVWWGKLTSARMVRVESDNVRRARAP
jgi:hypothetical protein